MSKDDNIKELIEAAVEHAVESKTEHQAKEIADIVIERLKKENIFSEDHSAQHKWLEEQIKQEAEFREKFSSMKWSIFTKLVGWFATGGLLFLGWSLIQYIKGIK